MTRLQRFLLPTFLLAAATLCHAETAVSGPITTATWTAAGSPYVLSGNVAVPTGATLIIGPGVEVRNGQITVSGSLRAQGTEDHPVEFVGTRLVADGALEFDLRYTTVRDVVYDDPDASTSIYGGGMLIKRCMATLTHCSILNNEVKQNTAIWFCMQWPLLGAYGGGIAVVDGATLLMDSSLVAGNFTEARRYEGRDTPSNVGHGGGICVEGARTRITNSTISGNWCTGAGGAICSPDSSDVTLVNCFVVGNKSPCLAGYIGGRLRGHSYVVPVGTYLNCTFAGDTAAGYTSSYETSIVQGGTLTNCIMSENWAVAPFPLTGGTVTYTNIVLSAGVWGGRGNINADPLFVDASAGNYSLQPGSPCINAGDPDLVLDRDGSLADMGVSDLAHIPGPAYAAAQSAIVYSGAATRHPLLNTGTQALTIADVALTGDFSVSLLLPATVPAGETLEIPISYSGADSSGGTMTISFDGDLVPDAIVHLAGMHGTPVDGSIVGATWTSAGNPYLVIGACEVPPGGALTIEPGVVVRFDADVPFTVQGSVKARGEADEVIEFREGRSQWQGIRVSGGDSSSFSYVRIAGGRHHLYGGGVFVSGEGTAVTFDGCDVAENQAYSFYYPAGSSMVHRGYGGGVYVGSHARVALSNCLIRQNSCAQAGSGVCVADTAELEMTRCVVWKNDNMYDGLSPYCKDTPGAVSAVRGGHAVITNCTIAENTGSRWIWNQTKRAAYTAGINASESPVTVVNTILWRTGLICFGQEHESCEARYTMLDDVDGYWGEMEPCPTYPIRINLDRLFASGATLTIGEPRFDGPATAGFPLRSDSPCINAGDPSLTDPDGSRSDIGSSWFAGPVSVAGNKRTPLSLFPNQPNPFNPVTTIPYSIAEAGPVTLSVYNLQGQLVRTLAQEIAQPGEHHAVWDGRDFAGRAAASGVYLCRLVAPEGVRTMRMTLVK